MTVSTETAQNPAQYSKGLIWLHWGMAALVVTAYIAVWSHEYFPRGSTERAFAMTTHFTVGLSVLLLVMLRLFVRSRQETPLIRPEPPVWQQSAATLAHVALYATMIAMPIAMPIATMSQGSWPPNMPSATAAISVACGASSGVGCAADGVPMP